MAVVAGSHGMRFFFFFFFSKVRRWNGSSCIDWEGKIGMMRRTAFFFFFVRRDRAIDVGLT